MGEHQGKMRGGEFVRPVHEQGGRVLTNVLKENHEWRPQYKGAGKTQEETRFWYGREETEKYARNKAGCSL